VGLVVIWSTAEQEVEPGEGGRYCFFRPSAIGDPLPAESEPTMLSLDTYVPA